MSMNFVRYHMFSYGLAHKVCSLEINIHHFIKLCFCHIPIGQVTADTRRINQDINLSSISKACCYSNFVW